MRQRMCRDHRIERTHRLPLRFKRRAQNSVMLCSSGIPWQYRDPNQELVKDPSLLRRDPYGRGWVATVHVPDEESTSRNLVPSGLVRNWMRDAVRRLYAHQPMLAGAAAADGGRPAEDLLAGVPEADWKEVTGEFFLTA